MKELTMRVKKGGMKVVDLKLRQEFSADGESWWKVITLSTLENGGAKVGAEEVGGELDGGQPVFWYEKYGPHDEVEVRTR